MIIPTTVSLSLKKLFKAVNNSLVAFSIDNLSSSLTKSDLLAIVLHKSRKVLYLFTYSSYTCL